MFEEAINEFVELCKEKFGDDLISVVLFGSVARGTAKKGSDIDLLIIVRGIPKRILDREDAVSEEIMKIIRKYHVRVMPVLLGLDDLSDRVINPLIYGILTGYEVLHDPHGFWDSYLQKIKPRILEKRPVYIEYGQRWQIADLI